MYEATATRSGGWWSVEIAGTGPHPIFTQGRTLEDAELMARDTIADVLDVDISSVMVRLTVAGAGDILAAVADARHERRRAAKYEQDVLARASADLVGQGISQRDAARLLGMSHQRVHQLLHRQPA